MKELFFCLGLLSLLATSSYADITDSGMLSIGSQAIIGGTMTVQGSAFSVGTSTLIVAGGSVTVQGSASFSSNSATFTVQNVQINFATSTTAGSNMLRIDRSGVYFPAAPIHNSSATGTGLSNFSTTSTNMGPCMTASTITITTEANPVRVTFNGVMFSPNPGENCILSFLIDGQFPAGYSSSMGIEQMTANTGWYAIPASFSFVTAALAAGSHSFCLTLKSVGGNACYVQANSNQMSSLAVTELR